MRILCAVTLVVALLFTSCAPVSAQTTVCNQSADIFYVNGVWNFTYPAALASEEALEIRLQSQMTEDEYLKTNFRVSYNPGDGYLGDALEAAVQFIGTDFAYFWSLVYQSDVAPQWFRDLTQQIAQREVALTQLHPEILAGFVASYQDALNAGRKVILVAHSQGNLFANGAATYLTSDQFQSFAIVAVATPDSYVATNVVSHTTSFIDLVINVAAAVGRRALGLPLPLPPNVLNFRVAPGNDWSGHAFVASYLDPGSNTESVILSNTLSALHSVVQPNQIAGQGPLTATLTWSGIGDVDLHILEPGGNEVSYLRKTGVAGYLDVDNTYGYGPEHYYTSCSNTVPGTYRFGLDYYRGSIPQTATLQVSAGELSRTFTTTLTTQDYNSRPAIPTAVVQVNKDPATGEITATITGP